MSVQVTIKALLQGVATDDVQRTQDAWRHLIREGDAASVAICFILEQGNWTVPGHSAHTRHLAMLLGLLNEIDPRAARRQAARLMNLKIDPVHRATVEHMSTRLADTPDHVTGEGIEIFVSPAVTDRDTALANAIEWLGNVPAPHLDAVNRVTIAPEARAFAYLDHYAMLFSDTCLTWPGSQQNNMARQLGLVLAERRFYSALAHKVYAHGLGGPVNRQRTEARRFANRMMRRAHPAIGVFGSPLSMLRAMMRSPEAGFRTH